MIMPNERYVTGGIGHQMTQDPIPQNALYNPEAEKMILGCMLAQPSEVIDEVTDTLQRHHFYVPAHQEVFQVLCAMHEAGDPIEVMLVHQKLVSLKLDAKTGSPEILGELLNSFATHLNVDSYIKIVWGEWKRRELLKVVVGIQQDIAEMPESVAAILDRAETAIFDQTKLTLEDQERPFCEVIHDAATEAIEWSEMGGGLRGHSTGFRRLDSVLGGWCPSTVVTIGGASGIGKSALALTLARHLLKQDIPGGYWSGEMSKKQMSYRIISGESIIPAKTIFDGKLTDREREIVRQVAGQTQRWPLHMNCEAGIEIAKLRSKARRWKRLHGIEWLVIDHAQLVRSKRHDDDKRGEVSEVSRNAKEMAMELGITVFLLSQLNCDRDAIPSSANLKESKTLIEDSDAILLMHQESADGEGSNRRYVINIAKQREGQDNVRFPVEYRAWCTHFQEGYNFS